MQDLLTSAIMPCHNNAALLPQVLSALSQQTVALDRFEITGAPRDLANLTAHRSVFADARFGESFRRAEDTEVLCRLKQQGYRLLRVDTAPVIHRHKLGSKRMMQRAFRYGIYQARLRLRYGRDSVEMAGVALAAKMLLTACLNLAGLAIWYLFYWPERLFHKGSSEGGNDKT